MEEENIRVPAPIRRERLIGEDTFDEDERIAQLMADGLNIDEANHIVHQQIQEANNKKKDADLQFLLHHNQLKELSQIEKKNKALENQQKHENIKFEKLKRIATENIRKFTPINQEKIREALKEFESTTKPLEIENTDYDSIVDEIDEMVDKKRLKSEDGHKILELFEVSVVEDDDDDDNKYKYIEGGRRRRRPRKTKKSRKSRKSKKSRKSRKSRK
jgi:hypothetical protein